MVNWLSCWSPTVSGIPAALKRRMNTPTPSPSCAADDCHATTKLPAGVFNLNDFVVTNVCRTFHDHDWPFDAPNTNDFLTALYCYFTHLYSASN